MRRDRVAPLRPHRRPRIPRAAAPTGSSSTAIVHDSSGPGCLCAGRLPRRMPQYSGDRSTGRAPDASTIARVKVLLVSFYFPAGGRRRRAAPAEAGAVPARARHRDARARARRPAVDPPRRGAPRADPGVGAPRPLPRPERPQARRGAPRQAGARARLGDPGAPVRAARPRPGRERLLEPDGDPRRDPPRARATRSTS